MNAVAQFITTATEDAAAYLADNNFPPLTEAQRSLFVAELTPQVPALLTDFEEAGLDGPGRRLLAVALALDVLTKVVWGQSTAADRAGLGLMLCTVASLKVNEIFRTAGYPSFSDAQRGVLVAGLRKKVVRLLASGRPLEECVEDVQEFARTAVEILMGPAPARAHLN